MNQAASSAKRDEFAHVYREYFTMVYNAIYTKIENTDVAEDLCQEVFIILYNKFEEVQNPRTWLYGTVRNVVMKYFRDKKSHVDIDEIFYDVSLTFVNGFKDARIIITEAIDEIIENDEDKMLLELIAYNNYTYSHVAKVLGTTRKKVHYRYGKLVKQIIEYLKSKGIKDLEELLV